MRSTHVALGVAGVLLAAGVVAATTTATTTTATSVSAAKAGEDAVLGIEQIAHHDAAGGEPTISPEEALAERVANFPALQPYDTTEPLVPVSELVGSLRAGSDDGAEKIPVFAAALAYGDLQRISPRLGSDVQIAADRPVWVLTAHDTVQNYGAISGTVAKTWDVYTVVVDGPSGDMIESGTGLDIEALGVEGAYVD
ncbi:hypothetical protein GTU73_01430 [Rathayibacter sp. VKM Ac-2804]|uniref:hypothetical protein n=1 Tax=Rathayibacter sp. VKM Ac-2804 TaxID=2609257 RepID=UPI00132EB7E7|nr:hypothetical protein [Rathayibacter sp. VKM Ac-2804]QHF22797.1 hypothetical protein GTU73_01430 [Rathayibacter sp. VKM Ac-2804]